ncbi:hypothetical protein SuNHUV7_20240 (plasmid) [Pseudoseohaeicola sp. NH-UV-7]
MPQKRRNFYLFPVQRRLKDLAQDKMYRNLWQRTKHVASTYTGTFIAVMLLNQLLFFGFCLNPICLIAAMPHVLFITAVVGSWINKLNNWGGGPRSDPGREHTKEKLKSVNPGTPRVSETVAGVIDAATEAMESVGKKLDKLNITLAAKSEYSQEKWFIESMLKISEQDLEIQERTKDPAFAAIFDKVVEGFDCDGDKKTVTTAPKVRQVADYSLPIEVEGASNESEIKLAVANIVAEHKNFLEQTKRKLHCDPALMATFERVMTENGGNRILAVLKRMDPPAPSSKGPASKPSAEIIPRKPVRLVNPRMQTGPVARREKRTDTGLYGSLSRGLSGNWTGGYYCDVHTIASEFTGKDERGNATWDNTRSDMGQQVYRLKYLNDYSVIPRIVQLISKEITAEGFDYIIPVPASKDRPRQPVDAIAQALGARINAPVLSGFLGKTSSVELKGMNDPKDRERLLKESIHIAGSEDISAMNVLLIDDLYRSGATLRACCDVLKEKGNVGEVWVLTMTKTRCNQ